MIRFPQQLTTPIMRTTSVVCLSIMFSSSTSLGMISIESGEQLESFNEPIHELIDLLKSESWIDRDQAMINLVRFSDLYPLEELENALLDPTLLFDQRTRVFQACLQRFQMIPKAGLGVSFGASSPGSIELQPIKNNPRFPASEMLNPGDELVMIGDQIPMGQFEVRAQILSRGPGETLPVTIIRADTLIELELPLGSFDDLSGAALLEPIIAHSAYTHRLARKGISIEPPSIMGEQITLEEWISVAFPDELAPDPHAPKLRMSTGIVMGNNQRIKIGYPHSRSIVKPYLSPDLVHQRAEIITQRSIRNQSNLQRAQLRIYILKRDTLISQLDTDLEDQRTQIIQNEIEELSQQIKAVEELLNLESEPDDSSSTESSDSE